MRNKSISNRERLEHIAEAISAIQNFIEGHTKETFLTNLVLINATLFQFSIIGEAIVHVDNDILEKYGYPWYKVRAFRNFIVHEYHAIEFRVVWETANKDLPELNKMIEVILENEFK